jgi:hypothetical protein
MSSTHLRASHVRAASGWSIIALALACVIVWRVPSALRAMQAADQAVASLSRCTTLASEVLTLRETMPAIAEASNRQSTRLINDVTTCLSRAGIASSAVAAVSPEDGRVETFQQVRYQRIRARITLRAVTLPQLGDFFSQWKSQQPGWIIDSVQLDPQPLDAKSLPRATQDKSTLARPLNVTLTMESLALAADNQP